MDADLPLQAESLPNHVRRLVEHFGKVTSALLLNQNGGHDDSQVLQRNPRDQVLHGRPQFQAVVLFVEADLELAADGVWRFIGHQTQRGDETVAGAQGAHHQIERLRQLLLEFIEALPAFMEHIKQSAQTPAATRSNRAKINRPGSQIDQICRDHKAGGGHQQQTAGGPLEIGLIEENAQARRKLDLQQPSD